jgi:ribosome-associated protein
VSGDGDDDGVLRVTRSCVIPLRELSWRFSRSGGPGGQHANKTDSRAEVRFDIAGSPSLGPRQRARLQERFGDEIRVVADDERSQLRNRQLALERLAARLASALHIERPRRPTKPTKGAVERRLADKRRRGERKTQRRRPGTDDA